jgi:sec-independent protein translocase protein TatC
MSTAHNRRRTGEHETEGGVMGLLDHLDELRSRLIKACIAVGVGMTAAFVFATPLSQFVLDSMKRALPAGITLTNSKPGEGFAFYFDLALISGIVLAAPFIAYQVWRFIAPGLYSSEKRVAIPFIAVAVVTSLGGLAFAHYLLFPTTMQFLASFRLAGVQQLWRVEDTFDLYKNTLLGMVAVFQLPTIVFFLARVRLVTARFLLRHFKHAFLASFIAAAALTASPDPGNQTLTAIPLIALYLVSIGIAWLVYPRTDASDGGERVLRLVFTAGVIDQALRAPRPARTRGWRIVS